MDNNGPEASKSKKRHREEDENSAESSDIDQILSLGQCIPLLKTLFNLKLFSIVLIFIYCLFSL